MGEAISAVGLFALGRVLPRLRRVAGTGTATPLQWLQASLPDDTYRATSTQLGRRVWHSFVTEQRTLLREIGSVEAALASVQAPTVVITGSWDVVVPPAVSAGIAAAIGGSELVTVARTGHFVPRDVPEVVASAVRRVEARAAAEGRPRHEQGTGA